MGPTLLASLMRARTLVLVLAPVLAALASLFILLGFFPELLAGGHASQGNPASPGASNPTHGSYSQGNAYPSAELTLTAGRGEEVLSLGSINFSESSNVVFKPEVQLLSGNARFILSATLELEGFAGSYKVDMPCVAASGMECFRVMVLIPGFDAPMLIEKGGYSARLRVSWQSSGDLKVRITLRYSLGKTFELEELPEPPEAPEWIPFNGSTRSYAVQVDGLASKVGEDGLASFKLLVWVYVPGGAEGAMQAKLRVEGDGVVEELPLELRAKGPYFEGAYLLKLPPGVYSVTVTLNNKALTATLRVLPR